MFYTLSTPSLIHRHTDTLSKTVTSMEILSIHPIFKKKIKVYI